MSMVLPSVALAGAFAGIFVGAGNGSVLLGILGGAVLITGLAWVYINLVKNEKLARWINIVGFGVIGFLVAGLMGGVLGLLGGWFFVWFIYWLYEGRYRRKLLPYLTAQQVFYHYLFRVICGAIFVFLITPILVVLPLSFNAQDFFTFTPEMLRLDPEGYSLKHYRDFFTNNEWQRSFKNSLIIAPIASS